jgi:beta-lactamase regulating signal transducer with metallopeptidase domain
MPPDFGPELEVIEAPPVEARPAAPSFSWNWLPATAGWTWLAGGILFASLQATRILRWRRRLMRGTSAPDGLEALVRDLAGAMGIRPPRLIVLPGVASPMVWCFGVPRLIWPPGLEDRLSAPGCRAVLLHELAHLRRRDHWVGWLLLAGGCVWWWHPLFWWVRRRLGQEAELACDAWVVGAVPDARRAYAEALLEVSQRMSAAVAVPALGAAGGRRDLERRLVMIMRGPASRRLSWVGLAGAIALGLLALPAWTLGEDKTAPQPAAPMSPKEVAGEPSSPPTQATAHLPTIPSQPAAPGSNAIKDSVLRERKLKELEHQVQQLLKEMQQLRGQAAIAPVPGAPIPGYTRYGDSIEYFTEVITLTRVSRVSYKLKPAATDALATFLKDNVKTAILETKSEGENLVVTTTPDAQKAIGEFIHLLQGPTDIPAPKKPHASGSPNGTYSGPDNKR